MIMKVHDCKKCEVGPVICAAVGEVIIAVTGDLLLLNTLAPEHMAEALIALRDSAKESVKLATAELKRREETAKQASQN